MYKEKGKTWVEKRKKGSLRITAVQSKNERIQKNNFQGKEQNQKEMATNISYNEELERNGNMIKKNNAGKTKIGNQKF